MSIRGGPWERDSGRRERERELYQAGDNNLSRERVCVCDQRAASGRKQYHKETTVRVGERLGLGKRACEPACTVPSGAGGLVKGSPFVTHTASAERLPPSF